jgi:hypothetical protein
MGIGSTLAVILIVLKALGLVTLAWGWCFLGFGVDIVLGVACFVGAFFFAKKAVSDKLPSRRRGVSHSTRWPRR